MAAVAPTGVDVEHKGLSLTLHFRRVPDAEDEAVAVGARRRGARSALHLRAAKMSLELHPPVDRRQGHGGGGALRGADGGGLHRRRRGRPPRLRRRSTAWPRAGGTVVKVAVRTPDVSDELARARRITGRRARGRARRCSARSTEPRGRELVVEPVGGGAGLGDRPQAAAPGRRARRPGMTSASWSTAAVPATSNGGVRSAAAPSRSHAPASGERASTAVALVDQRALGRDQVEAVADRVHEQHVGPAQQRDRPREVVLHVEHDRLPSVGAEPLVDLADLVLDPLAVGRVAGHVRRATRRRWPRTRHARGARVARRAARR